MLNFYSSNYTQVKKPYNQINIDKITKHINNNRERASSINIEKFKTKSKIMPTSNSLNKKITTLKTISVNKQIQYKKKSPIKKQTNTENNFFTSYNGVSNLKDTSYKTNNKMSKNLSINNLNKNIRISQVKNNSKNYSNNKLRRKKILSVDINNKKNNIKNISQMNNNNLKLITDAPIDNNKNVENNSNTTCSLNNTSNPTSNGAKTNNITKNMNNSNNINKTKAISVNHQNQNRTNVNVKSPEKKFSSNVFSTCIGASDKKGRNQKNNLGANKSNNNKKINLQIKQPLKLFEENTSMNLTTSGNYQVNFTNSNNNDKKYIKTNLKNSNTFYKLNHNNHSNFDTNNYKLLKEVVDIQVEMGKNLKDNPTNSKSKKYNDLRHAFESLLKILGNTIFKSNNNIINTFLEKIMNGYHEVVSAFSLENRKLKQVNYNLNEQYEKMAKELFNSSKTLKEKQKQIESLEKKIYYLENGKSNEKYMLSPKNKDSNNIIVNMNSLPKLKSEQNEKILKFNEKNLEDLDALYFYDKVKMNKKKSVSIPKILIKQKEEQDGDGEEEEEEEYEEDEKSKTIKCSSLNGEYLGLNDIKFKSPSFIKVRQAFY